MDKLLNEAVTMYPIDYLLLGAYWFFSQHPTIIIIINSSEIIINSMSIFMLKLNSLTFNPFISICGFYKNFLQDIEISSPLTLKNE